MRVDVHAHYFAPEYVDCLRRLGDPRAESPDAVPGGAPTLARQIEVLDTVGIDLQVLSVSLLQPYLPRAADAVEAARLSNDIYADATRGHGGRFAAFGCVPLPHVDAALAEAERCLDMLGMRGITIGCSVAGRPLDDAAFAPFFAELDRRAAVLFLHPVGQGLVPERDPHGLAWMVGAPFEDTVAALQLVMSGLTTRYPNIKVIVPHLGGTLPFLLGRIDGTVGRRRARGGPPLPFEGDASPLLRRLWYDTVNAHHAALRCACESFGADRLLLGTDFPYMQGAQLQYLLDVPHEIGLTAAETAALLGGTAQALLDIAPR
ncbi:MAG TPA: amidohydrolase family protein [Chloroflexota bacterium]|nr:amidohydrolase family protein [Chloroflexota bacterium]